MRTPTATAELGPRIRRERRTVAAMVALYCRDHHAAHRPGLCPECRDLLEFAEVRLARCPFQDCKPTCANCLIHCYRPDRREAMREVMRYAGPRMLARHPWLAIRHVLDGWRRAPGSPAVSTNRTATQKKVAR